VATGEPLEHADDLVLFQEEVCAGDFEQSPGGLGCPDHNESVPIGFGAVPSLEEGAKPCRVDEVQVPR
jgi:hypothetical protein